MVSGCTLNNPSWNHIQCFYCYIERPTSCWALSTLTPSLRRAWIACGNCERFSSVSRRSADPSSVPPRINFDCEYVAAYTCRSANSFEGNSFEGNTISSGQQRSASNGTPGLHSCDRGENNEDNKHSSSSTVVL